jgi:hypothetical protein
MKVRDGIAARDGRAGASAASAAADACLHQRRRDGPMFALFPFRMERNATSRSQGVAVSRTDGLWRPPERSEGMSTGAAIVEAGRRK